MNTVKINMDGGYENVEVLFHGHRVSLTVNPNNLVYGCDYYKNEGVVLRFKGEDPLEWDDAFREVCEHLPGAMKELMVKTLLLMPYLNLKVDAVESAIEKQQELEDEEERIPFSKLN